MVDKVLTPDDSSKIWEELNLRLKSKVGWENEEIQSTYAFKPHPITLPLPKYPVPDEEVPNASLEEQSIDAAAAFETFLGKGIDPSELDYSECLPLSKSRSLEVVHGYGQCVNESFADRLSKLRREIPEIVTALKSFDSYGHFSDSEPNQILPDPIQLHQLNNSLKDLSYSVGHKIQDLWPNTDIPAINEGSSKSVINMDLLVGALSVTNKQSKGQKIKASNNDHGTQACFNIREARTTMLTSDQIPLVQSLEGRLDLISNQLEGSSELVNKEKQTIFDILRNMTERMQLFNEDDLLETQLKILQTNLELLEGVPCPSDHETDESSPYPTKWDPDQILLTLWKDMVPYRSKLSEPEAMKQQLQHLSAQHTTIASLIEQLIFIEMSSVGTKVNLNHISHLLEELENDVKNVQHNFYDSLLLKD